MASGFLSLYPDTGRAVEGLQGKIAELGVMCWPRSVNGVGGTWETGILLLKRMYPGYKVRSGFLTGNAAACPPAVNAHLA